MGDKLERMAEALDNVSIRDDDDYCANNDVVSAAVETLRTLSAVLAKVVRRVCPGYRQVFRRAGSAAR